MLEGLRLQPRVVSQQLDAERDEQILEASRDAATAHESDRRIDERCRADIACVQIALVAGSEGPIGPADPASCDKRERQAHLGNDATEDGGDASHAHAPRKTGRVVEIGLIVGAEHLEHGSEGRACAAQRLTAVHPLADRHDRSGSQGIYEGIQRLIYDLDYLMKAVVSDMAGYEFLILRNLRISQKQL